MIIQFALLLASIASLVGAKGEFFDEPGAYSHETVRRKHYKTVNFTSPDFQTTLWHPEGVDFDSPYIFFTDTYRTRSRPIIISSKDLSLVYAGEEYDATENARVQRYNGEDYFTFWHGGNARGNDQGTCRFLNTKYEFVFDTKSYDLEWGTDQHECEVTADGTVLVTVYEPRPRDLSPIGGKVEDTMFDSCFQEIDIATETLLFQWCASDHIPVSETYAAYGKTSKGRGWDAYHINSVQKDGEGNYFVGLRRLFAVVKISGSDGSRIWQLGGKMNNFSDLSNGHALDFAWHHSARFSGRGLTQLTMFDNHNNAGERVVGCVGSSCSRGLRLELDYDAMTVRHLQSFYSPTGLLSYAMGSYQTLPNGNVLLSWGNNPQITEFSASGVPVMVFNFGPLDAAVRTYRVYKGDWQGKPGWPPSVAAKVYGDEAWFWMSWNGMTGVHSWAVYDADGRDVLDHINEGSTAKGSAATEGFETRIVVQNVQQYVRIAALNSRGEILGTSELLDLSTDLGNV